LEYHKSSQGICRIDDLELVPEEVIANKKDVKKYRRRLRRYGLDDFQSFTLVRNANKGITVNLPGPDGCNLNYIIPPIEPKPEPLPLALPPSVKLYTDMAGATITSSTGDDNATRPKLQVTRHKAKGGFKVRSKDESKRENGIAYLTKVFTLPRVLNETELFGYNQLTFISTEGVVHTYDRVSKKLLTVKINKKRGYVRAKKHEKRISYMHFGCKFFLGDVSINPSKAYSTGHVLASFGTNGKQKHVNPRPIHTMNKIVSVDKKEDVITCICRYREARKDDYHRITVPRVEVIMSRDNSGKPLAKTENKGMKKAVPAPVINIELEDLDVRYFD
jgi:hypothetical protein